MGQPLLRKGVESRACWPSAVAALLGTCGDATRVSSCGWGCWCSCQPHTRLLRELTQLILLSCVSCCQESTMRRMLSSLPAPSHPPLRPAVYMTTLTTAIAPRSTPTAWGLRQARAASPAGLPRPRRLPARRHWRVLPSLRTSPRNPLCTLAWWVTACASAQPAGRGCLRRLVCQGSAIADFNVAGFQVQGFRYKV